MAVELTVAPEAEQDIAEAYGWYERQRFGLGEEFLSRVDACIERVIRNPDGPKIVHENYRRILVRQFPYAVFYEHATDSVTV
jgi:plasmid stabilization system protein ParE